MKVVLSGHQPGGTPRSLLWAVGAWGGWLRNLTRYCLGSLFLSLSPVPVQSSPCPVPCPIWSRPFWEVFTISACLSSACLLTGRSG